MNTYTALSFELAKNDDGFLTTKAAIRAWLNYYEVKKFKLIPNDIYGFVVDVSCNVSFSDCDLKSIPVKFNHIKGNFFCSDNRLKNLKGCPEVVDGGFYCFNNNLTSLEHSPKHVGGFCSDLGNFNSEQYQEFLQQRAIEKEKELFESMQLTLTSSKKRSNKI